MKYNHPRFSLHDKVLSGLYVSMLKMVLEEHGYPLLGFNGSPQKLLHHRMRITPAEYIDIIERSVQPGGATSELGFHYGKLLNIAGAGTIGQLLMSCDTIEHAFEKFMYFSPLLSLSLQFDASWERDTFTVVVERICKKDVSKPAQWLLTESLFYCWLNQARFLTGKPLQFQAVSVNYSPPPHWKMYQSLLGCECTFDAPHNSVSIDRDFADSKITTANDVVRNLKERQCQEVLLRWQSRFSISEQIKTSLSESLPNIPSLEQMAQHLNLSRSSLYRKLRDAESSYQTIVDDFRRVQAMRYLCDTRMTICDIADHLGFSDASNFRRAFKKWTGFTPSELRDRTLPAELPREYFKYSREIPAPRRLDH